MERPLGRRDSVIGPWDDEHLKALLHFPRFPIRLIQQEPWQTWIGQRGGLKAVYSYLQTYPLSPSHRRILDVVLSNPEAVSDVYASQLNVSRATYFYQLRELVPALVQALNHWELNPPAPAPEPISLQPNLPIPLTNLVGAESILQTLSRLFLGDHVRLLTLLGTGGVGKTRTSIELARRLEDRFGSDVCFVDLSALRDPARVGEVIGQTLGLKDVSLSHLKSYLRPRKFLLILDNFEHLLPARQLVTDLLATAPRLKILVTSRSALHIYGEHEFVITPLAVPDTESVKDPAVWVQSPAMILFVQRAQAVNPSFALTDENAETVAELCLRLEGLPLAIELAAFQAKYFSPQAMLVRLSNDRRLTFLSQVPKRLPLHQQNMRAMLDWSYNLLPPDLQTLFSRLAVFSGGCTLDAAEVVCTQDNSQAEIQTGITALTDQSLLEQTSDTDGEPRFHMLGITREYAQEYLNQRGETNTFQQTHASYYLHYAEQQARERKTTPQEKTFILLRREYTNLQTALQWMIDHHEGELGLRLIAALWEYWKSAGDLREGRLLAQTVLEQTAGLRLPIRARVLRLAGWLAHDVRDFTTMLWTFQASHGLSESLNDPAGVGLALHGLGELAQLRGNPQSARQHINHALTLFIELGDQKQIAWSLDLLGRIEFGLGDLPAAQDYFERALTVFREVHSKTGLPFALVHLGQTWFYLGALEQAAPIFEECLALNTPSDQTQSSTSALALTYLAEIAASRAQTGQAREYNDQALHLSKQSDTNWCTEIAHFTAGLMAFRMGEFESAAFSFQESLGIQQSLKEGWRSLTLLEAVASLSVAIHNPLGAARLFGAAESLRESSGISRMPLYQDMVEESLQTLKSQIDPTALEEAWAAGRALSLEQALVYAVRCLE